MHLFSVSLGLLTNGDDVKIGGNYTRGYDVTPKNSTYDLRKKHTPGKLSVNGKWTGERGNSIFISDDIRVKSILDAYGVNGVEYKNGMPDFSPFAKCELTIDDMTDSRPHNFAEADKKLAEYLSKNGKQCTAQDVANWREANGYTWHELNDLRTMQLIPSNINMPIFKHLGGCGEYSLKETF